MSQSLTVNLPSELYVQIKERATHANRSVEEDAFTPNKPRSFAQLTQFVHL